MYQFQNGVKMKQRTLTLLLLLSSIIYGKVKILSKIPGRIQLEINFSNTSIGRNEKHDFVSHAIQVAAEDEGFEIFAKGIGKPTHHDASVIKEYLNKLQGAQSAFVLEKESIAYNSANVFKVRVTPYKLKQNAKIEIFDTIRVTITYKPQKGTKINNGAYRKRLQSVVVNADEIRIKKSRSIKSSHQTKLTSNRRYLSFSVDNGVSHNDDRETNVGNTCNGIYAVTSQDLLFLGKDIPFSSIAINSANRTIPEFTIPTVNDIPEGAISVHTYAIDNNSDGILNGDDKLLFYGGAQHAWVWNSQKNEWEFSFNQYDYRRIYWIYIAPQLPMPTISNSNNGNIVTYGLELIRKQQTHSLIHNTGNSFQGYSSRYWKWYTLFKNDSKSFQLPVFDEYKYTPISVRFTIPTHLGDLYLKTNNLQKSLVLNNKVSQWIQLPSSTNEVDLCLENSKKSYADILGYDVVYHRNLVYSSLNRPLHFYSLKDKGLMQYHITNNGVIKPLLFRVDEKNNKCAMVAFNIVNDVVQFTDSSGLGYEYFLLDEKGLKSPKLTPVEIANQGEFCQRSIHSIIGEYNYLIISSNELIHGANTFATLKAEDGYTPLVLNIDDVYREFSGGTRTPAALRNAMIYLRDRLPQLEYVVLWGSGHYDYKQLLSNEPNHIFPILDPYPERNPDVIEDYYVSLDVEDKIGEGGADYIISRVPITTTADADAFIEKVKAHQYDSSNTSDVWRNRVVLLSDDNVQAKSLDFANDHYLSNDFIQKWCQSIRPDIDMRTVHLYEYTFEDFTKPDARAAFFKELNRGCGYVNYFGHGAYNMITDEEVFKILDIPQLKNIGRYFFFSLFSCSVGFFDIPDSPDMASQLVIHPNVGAISTFASSRSSGHDSNQKAGRMLYKTIFHDSLSLQTVGVAAYNVKELSSSNQKYVLLGDPSFKAYEKRIPLVPNIQTMSGDSVTTCRVFDSIQVIANSPLWEKGAPFAVRLQNPFRTQEKTKDGDQFNDLEDITYCLPGNELFRNDNLKSDEGTAQTAVIVPRSVQQDTSGVRFTMSMQKGRTIHTGVAKELHVHGMNLDAMDTSDHVGPLIKVRLSPYKGEETDLKEHGFADAGPVIEIPGFTVVEKTFEGHDGKSKTVKEEYVKLDFVLCDSSGIDHYYDNPGEGITIEIDKILPMQSFNKHFKAVQGDTVGALSLVLLKEDIPGKGEYELQIQATDMLGNRSNEKYKLKVTDMGEETYSIGDVFMYPCPISRQKNTRIWFQEFSIDVIRATLKIYTLEGRLIRTIPDIKSGYEWDLRDQKGNLLSPNVYLYRLFVECEDRTSGNGQDGSRLLKSAIKKVTITP